MPGKMSKKGINFSQTRSTQKTYDQLPQGLKNSLSKEIHEKFRIEVLL